MSNGNSTLEDYKLRLAALECEKMEAEIQHLRERWWKKPGYIASAVPIVVAVSGLLAGIFTGYFDDRKQALEANIVNLEKQEKALQEKISKNQETIDNVFTTAKFVSSDAAYANSHLLACGARLTEEELAELNQEVISQNLRSRLKNCHGLVTDIRGITDEILAELDQHLTNMPISGWAEGLEIEVGPYRVLRSPDGRYYHLNTKKFYNSLEEIDAIESQSDG